MSPPRSRKRTVAPRAVLPALAGLLENSPVPLAVFQDGWVVYANRATLEVTGYVTELHGGTLVGRMAFDFVVPEERQAAVETGASVLATGITVRNVVRTLWNPVTGRRMRALCSAAATTWRRRPALAVSFTVLETEVEPATAGPAQSLTPREKAVAMAVARGLSTPEIARALGIKTLTVRTHLRNAYAKTGARNRVGLACVMLGIAASV